MKSKDRKKKEIELVEKEYVDSSQRIHDLYFGTNTTIDFKLGNTRGLAIVGVMRNVNAAYHFDVVFYNNNEIVNVTHLTSYSNLSYSLQNGVLTITCNTNYSRGFIIN